MSDHHARVLWQRDAAEPFVDQRYSRRHSWHFDGGAVVAGSSSPSVVRLPFSDPSAVDPEEALVASVSSCHLLWFLSLAAEAGWCVDDYDDDWQRLAWVMVRGPATIVDDVAHPIALALLRARYAPYRSMPLDDPRAHPIVRIAAARVTSWASRPSVTPPRRPPGCRRRSHRVRPRGPRP